MFCAVYCLDKSDTAALREEHLVVHRAYLDTFASHLFFSGPLQTPDASASLGSLFILNVDTFSQAEDFIGNEPFNKAGIFEKVTIHRMRKGRYNPALADRT
uniref:YciI family protein n=1 Tax=Bosea sp. NBC_00436 TaxID=2969620 RepID=A0A9E8CRK2_9HYPH